MQESKVDTKVAEFWDFESVDWGQKYGRRTSYFYRQRTFQEFLSASRLDRGSILDYGCGSGDITFPMLRRGNKVTGVDIAEGMVKQAIARAEKFGFASNASYHHLSSKVLKDITSERYDAIVCSSVLEYVEDDMSLVMMFHDILKDGGYLLVSVPDRKSIYCKLDKWIHGNKHLMPRFVPVSKLGYLEIQKRQYDVNAFVQEVEAVGFQLKARKHNTITLQRGMIMEKISNIPGIGMLAIMMFRRREPGA